MEENKPPSPTGDSSNIDQYNLSSSPAPKKHTALISGVIIIIVLVVGITGTVAAQRTGILTLPFLSKSLEPDEVLQRMFLSLSDISSAQYIFDIRAASEARDPGAEPFIRQSAKLDPQEEARMRDQQRFDDAVSLMKKIREYKEVGGGEGIYYPRTLLEVMPESDQGRISQELENGMYGYRQEDDGMNFLLVIELETEEARQKVQFLSHGTPTGMSLDRDSFPLPVQLESGKRGIFGVEEDSFYQSIPANLEARLSVSGTQQTGSNDAIEGQYNISGRLTMDGTSLVGDGDIVISNDYEAYIRINEFPSLGFFNVSPIKSKWIRFEAKDVDHDVQQLQNNDLLMRHYELFLTLAHEAEVIAVKREYPKENGLYHYEVSINREQLPDLYYNYTQMMQEEFGDDALVTYERQTHEYLQSQEFADLFNKWEENTKVELWIDDRKFYPVKASYSMRFVPPDKVEHMQGKQLGITLSVELKDINKPISITVPTDFMSAEEAMQLVFGSMFSEYDNSPERNGQLTPSVRGVMDYYLK